MSLTIDIATFDAQHREVMGMQHRFHRTDSLKDMQAVCRTLNRAKQDNLTVEFTMHTCDPEEKTQQMCEVLGLDDDSTMRELERQEDVEETRLLFIKVLELLLTLASRQVKHFTREKQPPGFVVEVNDFDHLYDKYFRGARTVTVPPLLVATGEKADLPTLERKVDTWVKETLAKGRTEPVIPYTKMGELPDSAPSRDVVIEDHDPSAD